MGAEAELIRAEPPPREDLDPIVVLVRRGEHEEAAARCVREHSRGIAKLCMAMLGDLAEAEEAVQETFLAAHRAIGQFRGEGRVFSWLISIARRICVRRLAVRERQAQKLLLVHDAEQNAETPHDLAEQRRRSHAVRTALAELKPSEREILLLRYQAGLSFREVAETCGLEEAAARKRASRALARLRKRLRNEVEG